MRHATLRATTLLIGLFSISTLHAQSLGRLDLSSDAARASTAARLTAINHAERLAATAWAQRNNVPERSVTPDGREMLLVRIDEDGLPEFWSTTNVEAAISTGVNLIRNVPPYNLDGTGVRIGLWEAGAIPRWTHQDFVGANLTIAGGQTTVRGTHATHVAGTIIGQGIHSYLIGGNPTQLMGMSPRAIMTAYDSVNDLAEMTAIAATVPNSSTGIVLSNHSYAQVSGWDTTTISSVTYPAWYGAWGDSQSRYFGNYNSSARDWDDLARQAPYYLIVRSAGNDRNDNPPSTGATFVYFNPDATFATYDPAIHPGKDGGPLGFDTISTRGVAKNILTVGAANDAVVGGVRNLTPGTITSFSSYGPADDGRIKPDIVANGAGLWSLSATNDTSFSNASGTSMSGPNAAGSAALLVQHWRNSFPGSEMLSSTLKALIIHTADDLGNPGPDYSYGWGYMNAKAAADVISDMAIDPGLNSIREGLLGSASQVDSFTFEFDGMSAIRATLCWIDPPGVATTIHNNPGLRLRNNLDLRITDPSGAVWFPFILDPSTPTAHATTGNNIRDNVEQVLIAAPPSAGTYTVTVSLTGSLFDGPQSYSLILTGQTSAESNVGDFLRYN